MDKKIVAICAVLLFGVSFYATQSLVSVSTGTQSLPTQENIEVAQPSVGKDTIKTQFSGPKTEECPINGEKLTKEERLVWEKRRPLVVMIENHIDARPQSGLSQADVIYEVVAEGGITRFASVFYCKDAPLIGPVRSARVYFIDYAGEYGQQPLYAHVGGANTPGPADALGKLRTLNWAGNNDLNQFSIPFPYFFRDYERLPNRATEHTMYSSTKKLWDFAREKRNLGNTDKKGSSWDKSFVKWKFKDDESSSDPSAIDISFGFWDNKSDYSVGWKYQLKENNYVRYHSDAPHIDKNTNKPLIAKNVVVLFVRESPANDGYPGGHRLYKTTGSGKGVVFQDGAAVDISWSKKDTLSRTVLTTKQSRELKFNRGKIWIEIVPEGNEISY
ncbi:hypothetical protein A3B46_00915 [Candidatus Roizmanbacteria bacterium RIFCSPLOWO2_01_FULL_39_19]|nr:MAG: hypothetical protein A3B46_00915 [Candidatus Roizmanbacteria bacterium RIFCSPLOWO2_01_FULL_39_19]